MIKGFYTPYYEPADKENIKSGWYIIISENEHELKTTPTLKTLVDMLETNFNLFEKQSEYIYKIVNDSIEVFIENLFILEQYKLTFSGQFTKKFNLRNPDFSGCINIFELEQKLLKFYQLIKMDFKVTTNDVDKILDKINNVGFDKLTAFDIVMLNKN